MARADVSYDRHLQTIRKMSAGTLGGQSKIATPVSRVLEIHLDVPSPTIASVTPCDDTPVVVGAPPNFFLYDMIALNPAGSILYGRDVGAGVFRLNYPSLGYIDPADTYWFDTDVNANVEAGLTCDPSGNVYYAEGGDDWSGPGDGGFTVWKVTPGGTKTSFADYSGFPDPTLPTAPSRGAPSLAWSVSDDCLYGFVQEGALGIGGWLCRIESGSVTILRDPSELGFIESTAGPVITPDNAVWWAADDGTDDITVYRYVPDGDTLNSVGPVTDTNVYAAVAHCDDTFSVERDPVGAGGAVRYRYTTALSASVEDATSGLGFYAGHSALDATFAVLVSSSGPTIYTWPCCG